MGVSRRNFIFGSVAATALCGTSTVKAGTRPLKPGENRTLAVIGLGAQSRGLIGQFTDPKFAGNVKVVAVCDCDKARVADGIARVNGAYARHKIASDCKGFADFREVLRDPSIDAVCIATPDHWHAYMSVEAMKHGKDVYCEKPLTFSIDEARKVIAAQKKYGRVFQTGSMQRSWDVFRTAVMIVRNGFIGDVMYVDANYGKGGAKLGGPSHPVRFFDKPENAAEEGAPNPDVDWNMWLGPAKWRPYSDQLAPRGAHKFFPMFWRFDDDIASGYNGDWGAHHLDIAQWGLDMDKSGPYEIVRSDEPHSKDLFHGGRRQFGMKMLFRKPYGTVELYHGPFGVWGTVFYGTKGIVAVNRGKIAVWEGTGLVKPDAKVRSSLQNVSFMPEKIVAKSYGKYAEDPARLLRFDQHLLMATLAPRALLVEGFDNPWFDTEGEFLAVRAARGVWSFLGRETMPDVGWPADESLSAVGSNLGYVRRSGRHGYSAKDWLWTLDFADRHWTAQKEGIGK